MLKETLMDSDAAMETYKIRMNRLNARYLKNKKALIRSLRNLYSYLLPATVDQYEAIIRRDHEMFTEYCEILNSIADTHKTLYLELSKELKELQEDA